LWPSFNAITSTFADTGWAISVMTSICMTNYMIDGVWRQNLDTLCALGRLFRPEC
jgi:hypothetical protein